MNTKRALTLIELLVVIAVIGILAAMVFPALVKAKNRAQAGVCQNNLRQLHLGWYNYAEDYNDRLAFNVGGQAAGKSLELPNWVTGELRLDCQWEDKADSTNVDMLVGNAYAAFGSIGGYLKNPAAYRCPADRSTVTIGGRAFPRVRSMSMNGYVGGHPREPAGRPFRVLRKLHDTSIPGPSETWVFMDEREDSINDGFFAVDGEARYAIVDYPASYHNGAGNLAFADGHSESHKWLETTIKPPLVPGERLPSDSKLTSPNDRDMVWLMSRTTSSQ